MTKFEQMIISKEPLGTFEYDLKQITNGCNYWIKDG